MDFSLFPRLRRAVNFWSRSSPSQTSRTLVINDFEPVDVIGQGSYGTVYQVEDKKTTTSLAMKVIAKAGTDVDDVFAERQTLRRLAEAGSPWHLSLRGSFHDTVNYYMLTDHYGAGDLFKQFNLAGSPTYDQVQLIVAELIVALESLHEQKIMHRDVKPGNILVDDTGHIVLADFGLARDFRRGLRSRKPEVVLSVCVTHCRCGSPAYMAPEVWKGEDYSFGADFWAVGIIMYYLLTFRLPFQLDSSSDWDVMCETVCEDPLTFQMYDKVDSAAKDFLFKILKKSSSERLTPAEMKAHRYFDGIDFEQVARREFTAPFEPKFEEPSFPEFRPFIAAGQPLKNNQPGGWFNFVGPSLVPPAPVCGSSKVEKAGSTGESPPPSGWRKLAKRRIPVTSFVQRQYTNLKKNVISVSAQVPRIPCGKKGSRTREHTACRGPSWLFVPRVRKV